MKIVITKQETIDAWCRENNGKFPGDIHIEMDISCGLNIGQI